MGIMESEALSSVGTVSAELLLDDDSSAFPGGQGYLAIETPLDRLFAEHRAKKLKIEAFAELASEKSGGILHYFVEASNVDEHDRRAYCVAPSFEAEPAVKALDAEYWQKAITLTDVLELMPAALRHEWSDQIRQHKTPAFEPATVRETLTTLLADRGKFFAQRVDRDLSSALPLACHQFAEWLQQADDSGVRGRSFGLRRIKKVRLHS